MLTIMVTTMEGYDEAKQEFVPVESFRLDLEHSLASLSKWESIWEKPFLGQEEKNGKELISYVKCMALDAQVPEEIFHKLSEENIDQINDYINAKMTATWFTSKKTSPNGSAVTAEIIYYWMIGMQIPFECQYWHLNRLLTLIRVVSEKNAPAKKMSKAEIIARNREINAQRRAQMGTTG